MLSRPGAWPVDLRTIEHAVHKLVAEGWPASFIMMFDEPWLLMHSISELMLKGAVSITLLDWGRAVVRICSSQTACMQTTAEPSSWGSFIQSYS